MRSSPCNHFAMALKMQLWPWKSLYISRQPLRPSRVENENVNINVNVNIVWCGKIENIPNIITLASSFDHVWECDSSTKPHLDLPFPDHPCSFIYHPDSS